MPLNYIIESDELFIYDEITDENKCEIDLNEFKSHLIKLGKRYEDLSKDEMINEAVKFDQDDLWKDLTDLFKPKSKKQK